MIIRSTKPVQLRPLTTAPRLAAASVTPALVNDTTRALAGATRVATERPGVSKAAFERAVSMLGDRVAADRAAQQAGTLRAHAEAIVKTQPTSAAKGTVILFHGFTAGPWQYAELSEKFHKAGYHVIAPRLPGHGEVGPDGKASGEGMIDANGLDAFDGYLDDIYREAAALGAPVYGLGLSGGGNAALRMAERHTEVKGTVAMAPFLGPDGPLRVGSRVLYALDKLTFGGLGWLLNKIDRAKGQEPADAANAMPHTQGSYGNVLAMRMVGHQVKKTDSPIQFITTHGDKMAGVGPIRDLYQRNGGARNNGWLHFAEAEGVPHAMVHRAQNQAPGTVDRLQAAAFNFIEQGRVTDRLPPA